MDSALRHYLAVYARGGEETVAIEWPDHPFVTEIPPSREFMRKRVEVETCRYLEGCHCQKSGHCTRPTRPKSLQGEQNKWRDVGWKSCLTCVAANEHSPKGG